MKNLFLIFISLLTLSSYASVWDATNEWDESFENEYQQWMTTHAVKADMFVSKESKYYGISADCADAAYALRAIFARENSLPFAITNPSGSRDRNNAISNKTNAFDKYNDLDRRFVEFINYIGDSVGSENLSRLDTYSVALNSIKPASLFTYKIKGRFGRSIRHVYTIKDIQSNGNFDLIYSTQAIKKSKLPMNYRKAKELVDLPHDVWGFKRFIWPQHLGINPSRYPEHYNYSTEQFSLASSMNSNEFFERVKSLLRTSEESVSQIIERSIDNICQEASARIVNVAQGYEYNNQINGRCMNYTEYDTYSTPARDKALKASYELLIYNFNKYENQIEDPEVEHLARAIVFNLESSELNSYCPLVVSSSYTFNLGQIWNKIKKGVMSSHPNDSLSARWGESTDRTKCKTWY
ncbi:hypothetical protein [Halobacteriovorax sp. HLS]|uniref:hypothetical protein n=1 Tax=Halobacteriovorax sp. HLS TaxID=2234000 RepID=UPI000FDA6747|nr:hypothetical protein [Halobacteriovorax sp. HLS]